MEEQNEDLNTEEKQEPLISEEVLDDDLELEKDIEDLPI